MKNLAPHILRQRLLIEGFYTIDVNKKVIEQFFERITDSLSLRAYGKPIVHSPSGIGKEINQGFDAFVPLIDSGIYLGVWANAKFLSSVIYTCKKFDEKEAVNVTKKFFKMKKIVSKSF